MLTAPVLMYICILVCIEVFKERRQILNRESGVGLYFFLKGDYNNAITVIKKLLQKEYIK